MGFLRLIGWLATNVVALAAACLIFDGIGFSGSSGWGEVADNLWGLLFAALILGIVNSFVSPIIKFLSLPFIVITLGLFLLVINALMIMLVSAVVKGFEVKGFWTAFFAGIFIAILSLLLDAALFGGGTLTTITAPHGTQV